MSPACSVTRRAYRGALLTSCVALCVTMAAATRRGTDPADSAAAVWRLLDAGAYADADRAATSGVEREERERGTDSLEAARASDVLVEALLRNGKAGARDTLALANRVVRLKEGRLGRDDPDLALSLDNLGRVHTDRGEMSAALPLLDRALSIRRRVFAPDDPVVSDSLDHLALPLILLQRFPDAQRALEESQRIPDGGTNRSPLALSRTLYLVALLHRYDGRYVEAAPLLQRVLEMRRHVLPRNHPEVGAVIQLQGELFFLQGNIAAARDAWSAALEIAERTLRPDHPDVALTLRYLANAAKAYGDLDTARLLIERAVPIAQQSLGPCHQEIPALMNDLASTATYEGDYAQARTLYATALATRERCLGPNDQRTATVVHNEALLAAEMGDFPRAEQLHGRAIRMWTAGLGPNHPFVARGLDALAEAVAAHGDLARARSLYERALATRQLTLGASHPDVAWTLANIAQVMGASGDVPLALRRVGQAIDIYQRTGAGDEPDHLARVLALRGTLEARGVNFAAARASFGEALVLRERIFGAAHPLSAESRGEVAAADLALGAYDNALDGALDAERVGRDHLRFTIRYLPERQALAYAAKRPRGLDLALSIAAAGHAPDPAVVLDAVIQSRGVILDELAARAKSAVGADPALASLNAAVAAARERFANLMLRSFEGGEAVPRTLLDDARQQKEDAERALAERSVAARTEVTRAQIGVRSVREALPADTALVSFVRYDRTTFTTTQGRTIARVVPSYLAFVMHAGADAVMAVPLGPAASIELAVRAWRDAVQISPAATSGAPGDAEPAYRAAGAPLRQRVWDPLAGHLVGATHLLIVPDGALNLVSFAALPTGTGRYLVETGPVIHLRSTERDLVPVDAAPAGRGMLAVGGPAYEIQAAGPVRVSAQRSGCAAVGPLRFEDLPGARAEAQELSRAWTPQPAEGGASAAAADTVTLLTGRAASKRAVILASAGRRIVHLATHGFFLGSPCQSGPAVTRGVGGLTAAAARASTVADNPLLFAGLAFAGANRPAGPSGQGDGILTAEEVAALNLHGTEWAVLSACDTGLGEVRAGEGVFGLRRAFQIAGVRTVIMSLWSVEDQSTRNWMRALYEGRFGRHLSTADAVHDASLRMLRQRRARGLSTHPFYWAAFVAAGDWH